MARYGVTYQDIATAATELKGSGKSVTIENVRAILGTGSIGTINSHLRKWKDAQINGMLPSQDILPDELVTLLKGLWERLTTCSREQFGPIEESLEKTISDLRHELDKYKNNNKRWQKLFNQWNQQKSALSKEKNTLEQALDFSLKENAAMTIKHDSLYHQLQDKQQRIDELNRLHKQAQANWEHLRESLREERLLDQQRFEREKQQLLSDITRSNEAFTLQKDQLTQLQHENKGLQKAIQTLEAESQQYEIKLKKISETLNETEKHKIVFEKDSLRWQTESSLLKKELNDKSENLFECQAEMKLINQKLSETNGLMDNLKNQNQMLINERWKLAQDKAQLEGQLKQMRSTLVSEAN